MKTTKRLTNPPTCAFPHPLPPITASSCSEPRAPAWKCLAEHQEDETSSVSACDHASSAECKNTPNVLEILPTPFFSFFFVDSNPGCAPSSRTVPGCVLHATSSLLQLIPPGLRVFNENPFETNKLKSARSECDLDVILCLLEQVAELMRERCYDMLRGPIGINFPLYLCNMASSFNHFS